MPSIPSSSAAFDSLVDAVQQVLQSEAELEKCIRGHKEHVQQLKERIARVTNNAPALELAMMQTQTSNSLPSPKRRSRKTPTWELEDWTSNPPAEMQQLDFWSRNRASSTNLRVTHAKSHYSSGSSEARTGTHSWCTQEKAGDKVRGQRFDCLVINPSSRFRTAWDVASACLVFYDVITVPLMVFGYDQIPTAQMVGYLLSTFWMCDLFKTFFVGYLREDGGVEMRIKYIARKYVRTWFGLDIAMILADLSVYAMDHLDVSSFSDAEAIRLSKTFRAIRIARFLRVLRLSRVLKLLTRMEDWCDVMLAASVMAFFNIVKLILGVALFAHFIACAWYYIGDSTSHGWVQRLNEENASLAYRYICAYHWTMAQFTPAPTDFHPKTMWERTFAVLVLFVGFVIFSSLLGSTTALISQARAKVASKMKNTENLRRFFVENHVSLELASRIMKTVRTDAKGKRRVKERDLIMLKSLPLSVQVELRYQVFAPVLSNAPFFGALAEVHPLVIPDLCHSAMKEVAVNLSEEMFHFGTRGTYVHFVVNGTFMYYPGPMTVFDSEPAAQKIIGENDTLAEAAPWVYWDHKGQLTASSPSDVIKVDTDVFRRFVRKTPAFAWLKGYAAMFAALGQQLEEHELDDTWMPFQSVDSMTEAMRSPPEVSAVWRTDKPQGAPKPLAARRVSSRETADTSENGDTVSEFLPYTLILSPTRDSSKIVLQSVSWRFDSQMTSTPSTSKETADNKTASPSAESVRQTDPEVTEDACISDGNARSLV